MKFCVVGAGNGGRAFAAYLSSRGHKVNLYNRSFSRIVDIKKKGGIKVYGEIKGFFRCNLVTQNLKSAIRGVDVILIVVPASAHKEIADKIAKYLSPDQIILLNPGRTFGAVEFRRTIEKKGFSSPIFVAETQTLIFTSRQLKKNGVKILRIKDTVDIAAFPEKDTFFVYDTLKDVFPQLNPVDDYLEMTLSNIGMLLHPTISLLNAGGMDCGKEFNFYAEGATPRTCEVLEVIQNELNKITEILGLKQLRFCNWANNSYGVKKRSIYNAIQNIKAYKNIRAPKHLITRYFTEDVPTGLVPVASLAKFLGVDTPIINSIINISSILCGINFKNEGRTIKKLGITNLIKKRIENKQDLENLEEISIKI
ncbi:MAG: NAD/NADP octopine/nopaline dehydrogenase family protein [Candidatus Thorarchaeota archaeon]